jgi:SET family sugar efflux transporter-like MFS transporter
MLDIGGFRYVYSMSALTYALALLVAVFWLDEVGPAAAAPTPAGTELPAPPSRFALAVTVVSFTLLMCPLILAVQALPLFLRDDLHEDVANAGLLLGLCAALEIPLMLALGLLTKRIALRRLLIAGACCGVAYYALAAVASGVGVLFAGQLLNALYICAVSGLGISYVQEMLPDQPGRASTLFSNTFPIGAVLAGPLFGLAQHFGYRLAYVLCTALSLAGLALLVGYRGSRARTGRTDTTAGNRRPA